tara:strand:- start:23391 stop:24485 length:1095 start_codon:yes stop_codon:yes gene_type:complete
MDHSMQLVKVVAEIGEYYNLKQEEKDDLHIAGWMHDIGYWKVKGEGHEAKGAEMAQEYLTELEFDQERIDRIKSLILATKMPQKPKSLPEQIICDADLYHLSSEQYFDQTVLLKKEKANLGYGKTSLIDWLKESKLFMQAHHYHTEYARTHFQPGKEANLASIELKIKEAGEAPKSSKKKDKNKKKADRGIETMFRITSKNHLALSALADNKANIMISVNSIIISIVVALFIQIIEEFPYYLVPTLMLIITCLIAMVFAILATRPNVTHGIVTKEDIRNKKGNLLYFGNFHEMSFPDYMGGMHEMMEDGTYLYDSMITDIYNLGIVLSKKYILLRKCYNIFMFGFVISVISFLIATYIFEPVAN